MTSILFLLCDSVCFRENVCLVTEWRRLPLKFVVMMVYSYDVTIHSRSSKKDFHWFPCQVRGYDGLLWRHNTFSIEQTRTIARRSACETRSYRCKNRCIWSYVRWVPVLALLFCRIFPVLVRCALNGFLAVLLLMTEILFREKPLWRQRFSR